MTDKIKEIKKEFNLKQSEKVLKEILNEKNIALLIKQKEGQQTLHIIYDFINHKKLRLQTKKDSSLHKKYIDIKERLKKLEIETARIILFGKE